MCRVPSSGAVVTVYSEFGADYKCSDPTRLVILSFTLYTFQGYVPGHWPATALAVSHSITTTTETTLVSHDRTPYLRALLLIHRVTVT